MTTYLSQDRLCNKENETMTYPHSKMYKSKAFLLFSAFLLVAGQASAAVGSADAPAPYRVSSDCMVCHGMTGHDTLYPIVPRLAGVGGSPYIPVAALDAVVVMIPVGGVNI